MGNGSAGRGVGATVEGRGEGSALGFVVSAEIVGVALGSWVLSNFVG